MADTLDRLKSTLSDRYTVPLRDHPNFQELMRP